MTIPEFKRLMTDSYISNDTVKKTYDLTDNKIFEDQFSAVSLENIIFANIATSMYVMQELFERFKIDVSAILNTQLSGTVNWYAYKARLFQFGMDLVPETDYYDNSGLTAEQIAARRVVRYAAAVEARDKSVLYLKVATDGASGEREPLSSKQLDAFRRYIDQVQYAGVRILIVNDPPDEMRLKIDIYYDPLVLDGTGRRLDGTNNTPVQNVIRNFLKNLPFNGTYTTQGLVDTLQVIHGVRIAEILFDKSKYGLLAEFTDINAREIPRSGYYKVSDENLILNFIADE
jgi:hypothetical protein